ncbi:MULTISPECIES: AMP-binding protein [Pantoea]|uniref:AMP-binding protein n=2 Tax=Pantoea TaxID=53335 RepID=A0A0U3JZX7_9GAMM|nr:MULTISPECIES: AMP-binding protein [Pantoea]ALV92748.1 AMP-binding protein [Pantoea vagans]KHJ69098.1 AMP-binding protein [Pantoea rodasii]
MKVLSIRDWLAATDRVVAWQGQQQHWLSEMRQQVQALAEKLRSQPGQHWALCFDNSYHFTAALLAVWYAGKTPVIPGHCRAAQLEEMAEHLDGVISDMSLALSMPHLRWDGALALGELPAIADDATLVLFTSGSTGTPRRVVKSLRALDLESHWLAHLWGQRLQQCHVIASVSHQHLYGLTFRIVLPMALSLPLAAQQIFYGEQLADQRSDRRYAFISSPAFLRRLDPSLTAPHCALVVSAGGALPWPAAQQAESALHCAVDEIYGSTETGVIGWRCASVEHAAWQCFPLVTLCEQQAGHWRVYSPLLETDEGWPLDDRIVQQPSGAFQLAGRQDRVVKIEDKRVSLSEIERRLLALPGVTDAAALAIHRHGRHAIGVVLALSETLDATALSLRKKQWRSELQPWLEPVAMPRYWRVVTTIPVTAQSKRAWPQIEELFDVAG